MTSISDKMLKIEYVSRRVETDVVNVTEEICSAEKRKSEK